MTRAWFTGDGKARVAPRLMLAGELGVFVYAARAGLQYRANDSGFDGAATGMRIAGPPRAQSGTYPLVRTVQDYR